eukprot:CAMPEP_0175082456 /NCGR_PEP_ID=MMETSP0052_2-20121109/26767_1 /TAXON_ID=51329 ORGANISM="Polytomella parva, Strain SAG 63-3" /NCGR_SAMPLE_ID=MMETSP0052_2 /ASSEMBLY_ACC=CAM_ASM_000194 /LENGTH=32 /DNA_ID= /DNA_START= /DNA_END= /DNA_ORIENTATION=
MARSLSAMAADGGVTSWSTFHQTAKGGEGGER